MTIKIIPADVGVDERLIRQVLRRNLSGRPDGGQFEWLYAGCPYGLARAWLAIDDSCGAPIGAAAAFPRRFSVGDKDLMAWVLGDFCLDIEYRSLGPALQLQRTCVREVAMGGAAFCYDFPSTSMMSVYKRLGFNVAGKMLRLAKPLRVDRKVKQVIKSPSGQRMLSSVGNAYLKMGLPKWSTDQSLEISIQQGSCGQEFTALVEEQRGSDEIHLQRSAEYLNWRYVNNPLAQHEIIRAHKSSRLLGYAVWMQKEEDASLVDLFGENHSGMIRRLVAEIAALAQKRGVVTLSVWLNDSHPFLSLFRDLGFRLRDSSPVVVIPSKSFHAKIHRELTGWYLMQGDRDS